MARGIFPLELYRRIARRVRLVSYWLIGGQRSGFVSLESGIRFEPKLDLMLARGVHLDRNGTFRGNGMVRIGERTRLGTDFSIHCMSKVTIGNDCMFGERVSILDNNHGMALGELMRTQPLHAKPVTIGNDCWISQGVIILAGVTIGDGCVVAAGAVVRDDVLPGSIVGGIPAKHIRMR